MKISIPEPCTEKWSTMSPTAQGAFCQVCSKEVIDFTGRTAPEIRDILAEQSAQGARVCGRIRKDQIKQFNAAEFTFDTAQQEVQTVWIFALMAVFGLALFSCQNTVSREIVEQLKVQTETLIEEEEEEGEGPENLAVATIDSNWTPITIIQPPDTHFSQIFKVEWKEFKIDTKDICTYGSMWIGTIADPGTVFMGDINPVFEAPILWPVQPYRVADMDQTHAEQKNGSQGPRPKEPRVSIPQPADTETLEFVASYAPLPITQDTRLIVEALTEIELICTLFHAQREVVFAARTPLKPAVYSLPIPFDELPKGSYTIVLESALTQQIFECSIGAHAEV